MPTERIAMRRAREMLRLSRDAGLATREVARRAGVAPSTLREMFRRFETSGLTWPLPLDLADAELEARLLRRSRDQAGPSRRAEPDWAALTPFLGRIERDTNTVDRAMRPLAMTRTNSLFAGSEGGAEHWAVLASLIATCKLNDVEPLKPLFAAMGHRPTSTRSRGNAPSGRRPWHRAQP